MTKPSSLDQILTKEFLEERQHLLDSALALEIESQHLIVVSSETVRRRRRAFGLVSLKSTKNIKVSKEVLKNLYIKQRKTMSEVGAILGVSETLIHTKIHEFGLPILNLSLRPEAQEKRRRTGESNYGSFEAQLDLARQKARANSIQKYGAVAYMYSRVYHDSRLKIKIEALKEKLPHYGYELLDPESYKGLQQRNQDSSYAGYFKYRIKHKCGLIFEDDVFNLPRCPVCLPFYRSRPELNWEEFIRSQGFEVQHRKKMLRNPGKRGLFDVDMFIPKLMFGFEYNSLYYHSTGHVPRDHAEAKYPNYHQCKSNAALKAGVKLYHIWDYHDPLIVESMIRNVLGLPERRLNARDLSLRKLKPTELFLFMEENHLHGHARSKIAWGLFEGDVLYQALSLRKYGKMPRFIEIARSASKKNHQIRGGFSKLLKQAIKWSQSKGFVKIITMADRDWSPDPAQTVYAKTGFRFLGDTGPSMSYTDHKHVFPRQMYQKHKLFEIFPETFKGLTVQEIEALSEHQILSLNGIYPLYTSGNWKYELDL